MKSVHLWDLRGAAVIVPASTGVSYTNQVNGTACFQPHMEGVLIPLEIDHQPASYEESLEHHLCSLFRRDYGEFDVNKALQLQAVLSAYRETEGVEVDIQRVGDSHESWVHVILHDAGFACYSGFDGCRAVLTWPNSD